jgi:hypothetical protein
MSMNLKVTLLEKSQIVDLLLKCDYKINTFENHIDGFKSINEGYFPRYHVRVEKNSHMDTWKGSYFNLHIDLEEPKHSYFWGKCYISTGNEITNEIKLLKKAQSDLLREFRSRSFGLKKENSPLYPPGKEESYVKIKQLKVSFRTIKTINCPKINNISKIRRKKIIEYISSNLDMIREDMHIIPPFNGTLRNLIESNDHLLLAADKYNPYLIFVRECRGLTDRKRNQACYKLKYYKVIINPLLEKRKMHYLAVLYDYMNGKLYVERIYNLN